MKIHSPETLCMKAAEWWSKDEHSRRLNIATLSAGSKTFTVAVAATGGAFLYAGASVAVVVAIAASVLSLASTIAMRISESCEIKREVIKSANGISTLLWVATTFIALPLVLRVGITYFSAILEPIKDLLPTTPSK